MSDTGARVLGLAAFVLPLLMVGVGLPLVHRRSPQNGWLGAAVASLALATMLALRAPHFRRLDATGDGALPPWYWPAVYGFAAVAALAFAIGLLVHRRRVARHRPTTEPA
jgi:hypothetical protein